MARTTDFAVIGGGIIGLNLALQAKRRYRACDVVVIEKEPHCGLHASGRNSGVLHAGFYYDSDSLKARFTREGNRRLTQYCEHRGLRINRCGKLVVAKNAAELLTLDALLRRAEANGILLEEISAEEARRIEPRVKTYQRALFSPTTSSVDPAEVMRALVQDVKETGVHILTSTAYVGRAQRNLRTTAGEFSAGYVINAAGLYADRIAQDFGFSNSYGILPFKGVYLYGDAGTESVKTNIYPVPDLRNPFLGVHFTVTATGTVNIGPTAIPAFWREQYSGFSNFSFRELIEVVIGEGLLLLRNNFGFRQMVLSELQKYSAGRLLKLASALVSDVGGRKHWKWGQAGIRAQLFNMEERKLEMDFRFQGDDKSFHVLNAVSPAFTCAMPFAEYLFSEIERRLA